MPATALSIVIPAYNERHRIARTLQATRAYLDAEAPDTEVLVVDDGSRDETVSIVQAVCDADPRIQLIRLPANRGKGAAVRAGMLRAKGDRVLFMDADLATPIEEIAKLQRALDDGAHIAIGSRGLDNSKIEVHQHPLRETMGKGFNLLVRMLAVRGFNDTQCGFKLFTREAAHTLFAETRVDRFAFDVEVLLLAEGRFRVSEVPVVWRHMQDSKISPVRDALRMAWDLLRMRILVAGRRRP